MDIRDATRVGTRCARCERQANVLIEEWAADRPSEESSWICPRCQTANVIGVRGKVVGVAIATGYVRSGRPR